MGSQRKSLGTVQDPSGMLGKFGVRNLQQDGAKVLLAFGEKCREKKARESQV